MDNDDIYIPDPNTYISINLQIKTRSHKINNHAGHFVPLPPQLVQNVQCPWIERGCGGHNRHSLARFDGLAKALDVAGLALMLLLKGNCWAAGYIEDIVHRRLKYIYIYIYVCVFLIHSQQPKLPLRPPIATTLQCSALGQPFCSGSLAFFCSAVGRVASCNMKAKVTVQPYI